MRTILIKIGSGTLLTKRGRLDEFRLAHVAEQVRVLRKKGMAVILVISGAVACGSKHVQIGGDESGRQVAAGIGQVAVISTIERIFAAKNIVIAQLLLTADALTSAAKQTKVREVLEAYARAGIVAVVNENDVVDLNGFGGNDMLAAQIATTVNAAQVLILSQMERSQYGVGGGETKLHAVRMLEERGIQARILNGKTENVIVENVA